MNVIVGEIVVGNANDFEFSLRVVWIGLVLALESNLLILLLQVRSFQAQAGRDIS